MDDRLYRKFAVLRLYPIRKKEIDMKHRLVAALFICLTAVPLSVFAGGFCTHGRSSVDSGMTATMLLHGDFDGDGKLDSLCKDIREHASNGNRLLMWLVLGNGDKPYYGVWDKWCTHVSSKIGMVRLGSRDVLTCDDGAGTHWERKLP
jgi:hypothetical protein